MPLCLTAGTITAWVGVQAFTLARALSSVGWTMPRLQPDDPIHKSHLARAVMVAGQVLGPA